MKTALKLPGIILLTAILTGCAAQKQVGRTDQAIASQALYGQALQALEEQHFTIEVGEFQFPDGKPPVTPPTAAFPCKTAVSSSASRRILLRTVLSTT